MAVATLGKKANKAVVKSGAGRAKKGSLKKKDIRSKKEEGERRKELQETVRLQKAEAKQLQIQADTAMELAEEAEEELHKLPRQDKRQSNRLRHKAPELNEQELDKVLQDTRARNSVINMVKKVDVEAEDDDEEYDEPDWVCTGCGASNPHDESKCLECHTSRQCKEFKGWGGTVLGGSQKNIWKCAVCRVANSIDATKCIACETARFGKDETSLQPAGSTTAVSNKTTKSPAFTFGASQPTGEAFTFGASQPTGEAFKFAPVAQPTGGFKFDPVAQPTGGFKFA